MHIENITKKNKNNDGNESYAKRGTFKLEDNNGVKTVLSSKLNKINEENDNEVNSSS